jgi:hypothetical protein
LTGCASQGLGSFDGSAKQREGPLCHAKKPAVGRREYLFLACCRQENNRKDQEGSAILLATCCLKALASSLQKRAFNSQMPVSSNKDKRE